MRRLLSLVVIALAVAAIASAASVCTAGDNVMTGGFSCNVGSITFSGFSFQGFGGYTPTMLQIGAVSQVGNEIRLDFSPIPTMVSTSGIDAWFKMTITGQHYGLDLINGGTGASSITERVCSQPLVGNVCPAGTELFTLSAGSGVRDAKLYASPQSVAYVWKDIGVGDGQVEGHMSSFSESVTIPEPMTFALIGSGLLGLGLLRRRARKG